MQLLKSADLVKGLVENSTEILKQLQDTKALVQDNALSISVRLLQINGGPMSHGIQEGSRQFYIEVMEG